jgi:hypothetical protein
LAFGANSLFSKADTLRDHARPRPRATSALNVSAESASGHGQNYDNDPTLHAYRQYTFYGTGVMGDECLYASTISTLSRALNDACTIAHRGDASLTLARKPLLMSSFSIVRCKSDKQLR